MHVCLVAVQDDDDDEDDEVFAVVPALTEKFRVFHLWVKLGTM